MGMNLAGPIQPSSACCQRSSASAPMMLPAAQVPLRLVVQLQPALGQRLAQRGRQVQVFEHAGVHAGVEETEGVAPGFLGLVHGQVGVLQQGVPLAAVARADGDAQRRGDVHVQPLQREGRGESLQHLGRDGGDGFLVAHLRQQQQEFIARQPRHGVGRAQHGLQALPHLAQQRIAGGVAERVVDGLEVVQVQEHDRNQRAVARGLRQHLLQPVLGQGAVGQLCQAVLVGQGGDAGVGVFQRLLFLVELLHEPAQVRRHHGDEQARDQEGNAQRHQPGQVQRLRRAAQPALDIEQVHRHQRDQHHPQQRRKQPARAEHAGKDQQAGKSHGRLVEQALAGDHQRDERRQQHAQRQPCRRQRAIALVQVAGAKQQRDGGELQRCA